jgi:hypothetical protein
MTYQIIVEGDNLRVVNKPSSGSKDYSISRNNRVRHETLCKVANNDIPTCVSCGCSDIRLLEINHKNGGGRQECKKNRS